MTSSAKKILYLTALLLFFPMSASAEIKIIIGAPAYKYNHHYSSQHSNKHHYKQSKHHRFNKYNFAPYSYRNNNYNFSHGYRYQPNKIYNYSYYNPYSSFRYNQRNKNAYRQGYKDGRHARNHHKKNFKLGH